MAAASRVRDWVDYFRADASDLGDRFLAVLLSVGGLLSVACLAAIVWAAGWHPVWRAVRSADWPFVIVAPIGVAVSHVAYTLAYREVAAVGEGPKLSPREAFTIVTTGFGPVSPRGGFALDGQELRKRGLDKEEAQRRVRVLGLLEYAVLAPAVFAAAIFLMLEGHRAQAGLLPSWVIGVPAGTAITVAALRRYRSAGRPASWWRFVRNQLDAVEDLVDLLRSWPAGLLAVSGMALYWAAEIAALAGCLDVFAHRRGAAAVMIVGYATGYALTRRSLPLAGAGVVEALLPFSMNWVGLPLAATVASVVAYRIFNLWLAIVPAVLGLRRLREAARAAVGDARAAGLGG